MAINDERLKALGQAIADAATAYESGLRFNDSMTYDEAHLLMLGGLLAGAGSNKKKTGGLNVVDASDRFKRERS